MISLEENCFLQVSVWDGTQSGFGWILSNDQSLQGVGFSQTTHYFAPMGSELKDPDVVIALSKKTGKIHAKVVGIDDQNFVKTYTFTWTGNSFSMDGTCKYGAAWPASPLIFASGYSYGRACSSPNIDANADGETIITWTETEEYAVEVNYGFPFPQPNTQFLKLKRGNVLGAFGDIGDGCLSCSAPRLVFQYTGPVTQTTFNFSAANSVQGFSMLDPSIYPSLNFEYLFPAGWFAHSDVSISERGGPKDQSIISVVFYNYKYLGGTGNPLHVNQFFVDMRNALCPKFDKSWNSFANYPGGRPRIASPTKLNPGLYDFHVALGFSGAYTDCDGNYSESSNLSLLGVYNGTEINGGQAVSIIDNADLTGNQNSEPAISYFIPKDNETSEFILVSWTHRGTPGTELGEVIAKIYKPDATPISSEYSIVNEAIFGNQATSSVAGRRQAFFASYFWNESTSNSLKGKFSSSTAGLEQLKSFQTCPEVQPIDNPESQELVAFPNPTTGEFNIDLKNIANSKIERVELIGPMGQKVQLDFSESAKSVKPRQKLSPGIYKLKVITDYRIFQQNVQVN